MHNLVIAEKPSVARTIAGVLHAAEKRKGYLEGNGWRVSWCLGHLVEDALPEAYDPRYKKWVWEDLPILPREWKYRIVEATKEQYEILAALMNASDVDSIILATDAGREGEAIGRLVYQQCGCTKPLRRLWISSLEDSAIQKGFAHLRSSTEFDNLYQAAVCRARADWIVGMNWSRAFTLHYHSATLHIGRVMTPTLALAVERERAITGFQKETFYTVELELRGFRAASGRFSSRTDADRLCAACAGQPAIVRTVERKEKSEQPPKLYDLTTLQRDANRLLDLTAQQTLNTVQSLYEKRLVTYPRTDSRYLTEDMASSLPDLCGTIAAALPFIGNAPPVTSVSRVVNDSKVTDHHAIIPTGETAKTDLSALKPEERSILHMIAVRLLCAVGEPHRYTETVVTLDCGGASFSAKGRTVTAEGWKATEKAFRDTLKKKEQTEEEAVASLPPLSEGQNVKNAGTRVKEGATKPPARFTDDTLLAAMKNASAEEFARIEDPERTGLGTSATQAGIIEKLVSLKLLQRKKKSLIPTQAGVELIRILPEEIRSAKLTAEWEEKLKQVERGTLAPGVFLSGIENMTAEMIRSLSGMPVEPSSLSRPSQHNRTVVGSCPRCGRNVVEGPKSFYCEAYRNQPPCRFALWKDNRFFSGKGKQITKRVAEKLLKNGRVHMTKLHSKKTGSDYDAVIVMEDTGEYVNFRLEFDRK